MKHFLVLAKFLILALCCFLPWGYGDVVSIVSSRDNTLFEDANGSLSNGSGADIFVGRTGPLNNNLIKRGLLYFDIASAVPNGATIDNVTLTLNMTQTVSGNQNVSLHSALADWGEGASVAFGGGGAPAAPGDATWLHTFSPGSFWANAGGDFNALSSATTPVGGLGFYNWNSLLLTADVQSWLDNSAGNFGWVVIGNESAIQTAKKFGSRENAIAANRPTLTIEFTPIPEPATAGILLIGTLAIASTRRRFI